jgi:hypothetical protein
MATKMFQSPLDGGGLSDGNPKNLVTIRQIAIIKWQSDFFNHSKRGPCHMFLESLQFVESFPKTCDTFLFWVDWKFW